MVVGSRTMRSWRILVLEICALYEHKLKFHDFGLDQRDPVEPQDNDRGIENQPGKAQLVARTYGCLVTLPPPINST